MASSGREPLRGVRVAVEDDREGGILVAVAARGELAHPPDGDAVVAVHRARSAPTSASDGRRLDGTSVCASPCSSTARLAATSASTSPVASARDARRRWRLLSDHGGRRGTACCAMVALDGHGRRHGSVGAAANSPESRATSVVRSHAPASTAVAHSAAPSTSPRAARRASHGECRTGSSTRRSETRRQADGEQPRGAAESAAATARTAPRRARAPASATGRSRTSAGRSTAPTGCRSTMTGPRGEPPAPPATMHEDGRQHRQHRHVAGEHRAGVVGRHRDRDAEQSEPAERRPETRRHGAERRPGGGEGGAGEQLDHPRREQVERPRRSVLGQPDRRDQRRRRGHQDRGDQQPAVPTRTPRQEPRARAATAGRTAPRRRATSSAAAQTVAPRRAGRRSSRRSGRRTRS